MTETSEREKFRAYEYYCASCFQTLVTGREIEGCPFCGSSRLSFQRAVKKKKHPPSDENSEPVSVSAQDLLRKMQKDSDDELEKATKGFPDSDERKEKQNKRLKPFPTMQSAMSTGGEKDFLYASLRAALLKALEEHENTLLTFGYYLKKLIKHMETIEKRLDVLEKRESEKE